MFSDQNGHFKLLIQQQSLATGSSIKSLHASQTLGLCVHTYTTISIFEI